LIFGKVASAFTNYEAFTPEVEVYVIDRDEFVNYIKKRPELLSGARKRLLADQMGGSIRLNAFAAFPSQRQIGLHAALFSANACKPAKQRP